MTSSGIKMMAATAMVGAIAAWAAGPHAALADPTAPKSAADCRAVSDFDLRGKCWDALDTAAQKGAEEAQEAKKRGFGLGLHYPSIAAVLPKREEIRAREQKVKAEEITNQTLTLASVDNTPVGHLLLTSTDGAVWEQTDGDAYAGSLAPGDTVEVSKGMFDGYMCRISRWQSVRCQRDK